MTTTRSRTSLAALVLASAALVGACSNGSTHSSTTTSSRQALKDVSPVVRSQVEPQAANSILVSTLGVKVPESSTSCVSLSSTMPVYTVHSDCNVGNYTRIKVRSRYYVDGATVTATYKDRTGTYEFNKVGPGWKMKRVACKVAGQKAPLDKC